MMVIQMRNSNEERNSTTRLRLQEQTWILEMITSADFWEFLPDESDSARPVGLPQKALQKADDLNQYEAKPKNIEKETFER